MRATQNCHKQPLYMKSCCQRSTKSSILCLLKSGKICHILPIKKLMILSLTLKFFLIIFKPKPTTSNLTHVNLKHKKSRSEISLTIQTNYYIHSLQGKFNQCNNLNFYFVCGQNLLHMLWIHTSKIPNIYWFKCKHL